MSSPCYSYLFLFFFLNNPPPPKISPLPLHAPLPIYPPRRPEPHRRIVARQRRPLAAVRGFVQREQHQRESRIVAVRIEQRPQVARELGRYRNVPPAIGPGPLEQRLGVAPVRPPVELHHQ